MSAEQVPAPLPLHVEVARALGWTNLMQIDELRNRLPDGTCQQIWIGNNPSRKGPRWRGSRVPIFDKDWGAAGVLIERLCALGEVTLGVGSVPPSGAISVGAWPVFRFARVGRYCGKGNTELEAICSLFLELKF